MRYLGGKVLWRRRDELNLTRREVADRMAKRNASITEGTLENWENDRTMPDADDLGSLAAVLELSMSDLFKGDGAS